MTEFELMISKKTTVIYHSADFDGIFCREIARRFLGDENINYIGWNFGDAPLPFIGVGEACYVFDLPLDAPFGLRWHEGAMFGENPTERRADLPDFVWIDHHATSIATHPARIPGYRIDGVAACRLAWQWFSRAGARKSCSCSTPGAVIVGECPSCEAPMPTKQAFIERKVVEPLAVRLAGEYDVWDKRDPDADIFQYALRATDPTTYWPGLLDPTMDSELTDCQVSQAVVYSIIPFGIAAQRYARTVDAANMKASFIREWEGLKFLCLNGRGNSLTFASRDVPETGHDALMMFYHNGEKLCVSLYHANHRKDLDLSAIAVKHGGGGHRGACGFTCKALSCEF